jgi:hypothetical protein
VAQHLIIFWGFVIRRSRGSIGIWRQLRLFARLGEPFVQFTRYMLRRLSALAWRSSASHAPDRDHRDRHVFQRVLVIARTTRLLDLRRCRGGADAERSGSRCSGAW